MRVFVLQNYVRLCKWVAYFPLCVVFVMSCRTHIDDHSHQSKLSVVVGENDRYIVILSPVGSSVEEDTEVESDRKRHHRFYTCILSDKHKDAESTRKSLIVKDSCVNTFLYSSQKFNVHQAPLAFSLEFLDMRSLTEEQTANYIERQKLLQNYQNSLNSKKWWDWFGFAAMFAGVVRFASIKEMGDELLTKPGMRKMGVAVLMFSSGYGLLQAHIAKQNKVRELREVDLPKIQERFDQSTIPAPLYDRPENWLMLFESWSEIMSTNIQDQVKVKSVKDFLAHLGRYIEFVIFREDVQFATISHVCYPLQDQDTLQVKTKCDEHYISDFVIPDSIEENTENSLK